MSQKRPFYFSFEGKTVRDGLPLGFTFDTAEWRRARDVIKSNSRTYYPRASDEEIPKRKLPSEERRKSRYFKLGDVFKDADLSNAIINKLPWFYDLTTWKQYCTLIISGHHEEVRRPYGFVTGHISTGEDNSE